MSKKKVLRRKYDSSVVSEINDKIKKALNSISELQEIIRTLAMQKAVIEIAPYKIGQDVMCEVPVGRRKSVCKCKLGVDIELSGNYSLNVTPYKLDGELSSRKFTLYDYKESPLELISGVTE